MKSSSIARIRVLSCGIAVALACSTVGSAADVSDPPDTLRWRRKMNGIGGYQSIVGIAVHPTDANRAWVLTQDLVGSTQVASGVYRTTNGGGSWTPSNGSGSGALPTTTLFYKGVGTDRLTLDPHDSDTLYVSVYGQMHRSTDGGQSWHAFYLGSQIDGAYTIHGVLVDRFSSSPRRLWGGSIRGGGAGGVVFKSFVPGPAQPPPWSIVFSDIDRNDHWTLRQDPFAANTLYCATVHGRVRRSFDAGATWYELVGNSVIPNLDAGTSLAVGSYQGQTALHLAFHDRYYRGLVTGSGPISWQWRSGPDGARDIQVAPSDSETAYAATRWGAMKTTNGGQNWNSVNGWTREMGLTGLAIQAGNPNVVYFGSLANGVYRTLDGGSTFESRSSGLPAANPNVTHVAISRASPQQAYAFVSGQGIYRTQDQGESWSFFNRDTSLGVAQDVLIHDTTDTRMFAACDEMVRYTYVPSGPSQTWTGSAIPYSRATRVSAGLDHVWVGAEAVANWHPTYQHAHDRHRYLELEYAWWAPAIGHYLPRLHHPLEQTATASMSLVDIDHDPSNLLRGWFAVPRAQRMGQVTSDTGLYLTTNGFESFSKLRSGEFHHVVVDPLVPSRVYAIESNLNSGGPLVVKLHVTENGGANWSELDLAGAVNHFGRLRFDHEGTPAFVDTTSVRRIVRYGAGSYGITTVTGLGLPSGSGGPVFWDHARRHAGVVSNPTTGERWVIAQGQLYKLGTF